MSAIFVAVVCGGPGGHSQRQVAVDDERFVHWREGEGAGGIADPIPGGAAVLVVDPFHRTVLVEDGEAYEHDPRAQRWWRRYREDDVKRGKDGPAYIAAGSSCDSIWVQTPDGQLHLWDVNSRRPIGPPAPSRVLAFDVPHLTVILEGGERLVLVSGRWLGMTGLLGGDKVKCRALRGCAVAVEMNADGKPTKVVDVAPGDLVELGEREARKLIARGVLEPAPDADVAPPGGR